MNKNSSRLQIISDAVCGVLMLASILTFLLVGIFVPDSWHPMWVILPSAGLMCGIISIITSAIVKCRGIKEEIKDTEKVEEK